MKRLITLWSLACLSPVFAQVPEHLQVHTNLQTTADKLDAGGPVYMITDGQYLWESIKPLMDMVTSGITLAIQQEGAPLSPAAQLALANLETLPESIGVTEIKAQGQSTLQLPSGGYRSIQVLEPQADAKGLLWNLHGEEFSISEEIKRLPANTAFYGRFSVNAPLLRIKLEEALSTYAPDEVQGLKKAEQDLKTMGIPVEDILKSLKNGVTVALTLDANQPVALPTGGAPAPTPGLILQLEDEHGTLHNLVKNILGAQLPPQFQFITAERNGVSVDRIAALPLPIPIAVNPQMSRLGSRLVFASSDAAMDELIARKDGTQDSPLLKQVADLGTDQAYQIWVVTPELEKLVADSTKMGMQMAAAMEPEAAGLMESYNGLFALPKVMSTRVEDGMGITTLLHDKPQLTSQGGGSAIMAAPAVGGLLAAIAIPGFQKARSRAQDNACINNLRLMEGAQDQWAIEVGKEIGTPVTQLDIMPYLVAVPECPAGGTYNLTAVGTSPTCSLHGGLDW